MFLEDEVTRVVEVAKIVYALWTFINYVSSRLQADSSAKCKEFN